MTTTTDTTNPITAEVSDWLTDWLIRVGQLNATEVEFPTGKCSFKIESNSFYLFIFKLFMCLCGRGG